MVFEEMAELQKTSIHTPNTGSDYRHFNIFLKSKTSIHTPNTGSDKTVTSLLK